MRQIIILPDNSTNINSVISRETTNISEIIKDFTSINTGIYYARSQISNNNTG